MSGFKKLLVKFSSLQLVPGVLAKTFKILFFQSNGRKKVVVSLVQHLGDNVAVEPLDAYLRSQHKDDLIIRIIDRKFSEVICYSPHHDNIVTVSCLSEWVYLKIILQIFYRVYDLHVHRSFCPVFRLSVNNKNEYGTTVENYYDFGNLLKTFCVNAGVPVIDRKPVYWMGPATVLQPLSSPYVVIHVNSNHSSREWQREKWIDLIQYIRKYYGMEVIEIGLSSTLDCNEEGYINLCGKLSFSQIALLISKARLFIGIDSAFAHFANSFPLDKLFLLGHFGTFRNYLPYSGLSEEELESSIVRYEGELKDLPPDTVKSKLRKHLGNEKRG
jgi:heptosyltransferase-3